MAARVNTSTYAILGVLSLGPHSGYDVKKLVERSIAHFWSESFGQIYPVLQRLEREGLAARRSERQKGKPDRQVYSITPRGSAALADWLGQPIRRETYRSELLLKLFLGGRLSPEDNIRHVQQFRAEQGQLLLAYADIERRLRHEHARHPDLPYWLMTLRYGRCRATALAGWADETLRALSRFKPRGSRRRAVPAGPPPGPPSGRRGR
jgi:DNA-binding PadR family transcriptional regulator